MLTSSIHTHVGLFYPIKLGTPITSKWKICYYHSNETSLPMKLILKKWQGWDFKPQIAKSFMPELVSFASQPTGSRVQICSCLYWQVQPGEERGGWRGRRSEKIRKLEDLCWKNNSWIIVPERAKRRNSRDKIIKEILGWTRSLFRFLCKILW